jgi:subtilisin family serine protease
MNMVRRPGRSSPAGGRQFDTSAPSSDAGPRSAAAPDLTPGVLIAYEREAVKEVMARLQGSVGIRSIAYASEFAGQAVDLAQARQAGMVVFDNLGVAVIDADPDQAASMAILSGDPAIAAIEPEPIYFAFVDGAPADFQTYFRGYKDAVDHLYEKLMGGGRAGVSQGGAAAQAFQDTADATWGLVATQSISSKFSGRGVRVAVLDTGLDVDHPDYRGRHVVSQSFIPEQSADDDNGHGTHCIGTACGPNGPVRGPRYGIAYEAEIYVGKVLSNQGSSLGRSTLAGMEWAVSNGCHIVSMSLGGSVQPGQRHLTAFEAAAREALRRNSLIVAAAGNDSRRVQGKVRPVSSPANCPSIIAVAAVDRVLRTADFSNGSINAEGRVDIAGPGVDVYASAPEPAATPQPPFFRQWSAQYDTISGTSQATPHVAGIAALLRQENPSLTASELWRLLTSRAQPLPQPSGDVGAGLVQG